MNKRPSTSCQLYLITPPAFDPAVMANDLKATLDAGAADDFIGAVQLRLKDTDDDTIRRAADALRPVCAAADVPLIMNDRPDLARETGCDGVHIGQSDGDYDAARAVVGEDGVVGVTCHDSRHLAMEAGERGADYVAFGAFFASATKDARYHAETDVLEWWSEIFILPCVAIGGITPANCGPLVTAGADMLAVVSTVWTHDDGPAAAVGAFRDAIAKAS